MLGSRGIPARYSGVERHVEELGARLVERGHDVVVFCNNAQVDDRSPTYRGMALRHLPAVPTKHLETISSTALATASAMVGFDVVHYHALGPGLLAPAPRWLSRAAVVQTVHGRDGHRAKWGTGARLVLGLAERMSARVPDATIVVSSTLAGDYRRAYGTEPDVIPNGVTAPEPVGPEVVAERFGLAPGGYVLFVGRLVPEKAADLLVRAFAHVETDLRLVVAGGSAHTDGYVQHLRRLAALDDRVVLTGPVYDEACQALLRHATVFVSPSELEAGAPLTLLEAAMHGTPVLVSDIAAQREGVPVDGPGQRLFTAGDEADLAAALARVLADVEGERAGAESMRRRLSGLHDWEAVTSATEAVYRRVAGRTRRAVTA
jgi:glycosyltransferase involved in cell wall biosynthesis